MSGTDITSAGIPISHIDQVAVAVLHVLKTSQRICDWARGGIYRAEALAEPMTGLLTPFIVVGAFSADPIFEPNERVTLSLPIGISLTWESPLGWLNDDDPTIAAVQAQIQRDLISNYFLEVPQSGGRRLVKRLHEFRPISYEQIKEVEGNVTALSMMLLADYRVTLNARTWEIMPP